MLVFEYPWVLFLLPLPLLVWVLLPPYREQQPAVLIPFFEEAARAAGLKPTRGAIIPPRNVLQRILAPVVWGLLVLALARPQWVEDPVERIQSARDLLLALDISQSMETNDFIDREGQRISRLSAVKQVVEDFITRREGDRIGLIVFGSAAYPQVPLTLDHEAVKVLLEEIDAGMAGPQTAIGDAIGLSIKLLETSKLEERVLLLLTDGNDTASRMPPDKAAVIASGKGIAIHTIAIGDPDGSGEQKVDLASLQEIARVTGGRFFRGENREELTEIYRTIDEMTPQNFERFTYRPRTPLFQWPLAGALGLLLMYQVIMALWTILMERRARYPVNSSKAGASTG